mgnify:FL=1
MDPKNAIKATQSILDEFSNVKDNVSDREMTKAIKYMQGRLLLRMEDTRSVAAWFGAQEILHSQNLSVEDMLKDIETLKPDNIRRVAKNILDQNKLSMAVVGPFSDETNFSDILKIR